MMKGRWESRVPPEPRVGRLDQRIGIMTRCTIDVKAKVWKRTSPASLLGCGTPVSVRSTRNMRAFLSACSQRSARTSMRRKPATTAPGDEFESGPCVAAALREAGQMTGQSIGWGRRSLSRWFL